MLPRGLRSPGLDFEFGVISLGLAGDGGGLQFGLCLCLGPGDGLVDRRAVALGLVACPLRGELLDACLRAD
jgi:hypothetical protein